MKKLCVLLGTLSLLLSACSNTTEDYADVTPTLDIRQYLNGPLTAKGILYDYSGKAELMFVVTMNGTWKGNEGKLVEHFRYSDGRKESRTWNIQFTDDHHFTATAADVVGEATGTQNGNSLNMRYMLNAKRPNGKTIRLSMDDWMYLIDAQTLINRTQIRKIGLPVGELVISFEKGPVYAK